MLTRRLVDLLSEPGRVEVAAQAATQTEAVSRLQEATLTTCWSSTSSSRKATAWR